MSFKFNPVTGNLDLVGAGGTTGGGSLPRYLIAEGEVFTIALNEINLSVDDFEVLGTLNLIGRLQILTIP